MSGLPTVDVTDLKVIRFSRVSVMTGKMRTGFVSHVNCVTHKVVMTSRAKALCLKTEGLATLAANMERYADRQADVVPGSVQLVPADAANVARYVGEQRAIIARYGDR